MDERLIRSSAQALIHLSYSKACEAPMLYSSGGDIHTIAIPPLFYKSEGWDIEK